MCIITELKTGSQAALKRLFDEYQQAVYYYVFEKTKSEYCSKEVVQLSFIKLWNYRQRLKEDVDISYQLFCIARTTMIDEVRKMQRNEKVVTATAFKIAEQHMEDEIDYNDTRRKLQQLVALMPGVRQQVFYLSRFNNYSHKEIARALSISPKTVESHIHLAIKFLKPFFPVILCCICLL